VKVQTVLQSIKDERGQDLIEYALLAALIAVACVAIMGTLASSISTEFGNITAKLT
jgi:pilus assembly protein Flp/PilA